MCEGEYRHLEADERVGEPERDVLRVGVRAELRDRAAGDEDGDEDRLPEGEEEDAFDAEELGHGAEGASASGSASREYTTDRKGFKSSLMHIQKMARQ